jgi:multidrug efflux system membrane fusion protein
MRTLLLGAALFCGLALYVAGCGSTPAGEKNEKPPEKKADAPAAAAPAKKRLYPVRTLRVVSRPVQYELQAIGSIEAQDVYRIDARVNGTIYDVAFNEGDAVTPESVLCRIAPEAYRQYALKAKALYDQAVHQLADTRRKNTNEIERRRIQLSNAALEIARRKAVKDAGAISNEEIELYQSKRDLAELELKDAGQAAETEVKVLEATIAQRDAELKIAEDDVRKSTLISPIPGVIEKRMVTNLMFVTPGTPLATVVDVRTLKLVFKVSERDSAALHIDQTVEFSVPAFPGKSFEAKVYFIENRLDVDARVLVCYARVTKELEKLRPGFYASVKIITDNKLKAVVVPATAILPTEKGFVAYVVKDGKAVKRVVKTGLTVSNSEVEILSGLEEGETLVVEGANALQEGSPLRILNDEKMPGEAVSERGPVAPADKDQTVR